MQFLLFCNITQDFLLRRIAVRTILKDFYGKHKLKYNLMYEYEQIQQCHVLNIQKCLPKSPSHFLKSKVWKRNQNAAFQKNQINYSDILPITINSFISLAVQFGHAWAGIKGWHGKRNTYYTKISNSIYPFIPINLFFSV